MWIRAHFNNGDEVIIQTKNITCFYKDQSAGANKDTIIQFVGNEDNYIIVQESVNEIRERIMDALNV